MKWKSQRYRNSKPQDYPIWTISDITKEELQQAVALIEQGNAYKFFTTASGRDVEEPVPQLKKLQSRINDWLKTTSTFKYRHSHAYMKGRSVLTALKSHVCKQTVVRIDIHKFFPSIRIEWIRDQLGSTVQRQKDPDTGNMVYSKLCPKSISLLAKVCTINGRLPIGAPSSPIISNICMLYFDYKLARYAKKKNLDYTRYADDLVISGKRAHLFIPFVYKLLRLHGLSPNLNKTKVMHRKNQQKVFGIILNGIPRAAMTVDRRYRRRLRAMRHQQKLAEDSAPKGKGLLDYREDVSQLVVNGQASWIRHVHKQANAVLTTPKRKAKWEVLTMQSVKKQRRRKRIRKTARRHGRRRRHILMV